MRPTCLVVSDSCCSICSTTFLKGGLLKGSASQQDLMIWYLHSSSSKRRTQRASGGCSSVSTPPSHPSHLKLTFRWVQTPGHPFCIPLLPVCRTWRPQAYQDRDCFLHSAGRLRCISTSDKGARSRANMNKHRVEFWTYRVRRFPTAKCRRTTRRSQMCTRIRRCFLETSTWPAGEPERRDGSSRGKYWSTRPPLYSNIIINTAGTSLWTSGFPSDQNMSRMLFKVGPDFNAHFFDGFVALELVRQWSAVDQLASVGGSILLLLDKLTEYLSLKVPYYENFQIFIFHLGLKWSILALFVIYI